MKKNPNIDQPVHQGALKKGVDRRKFLRIGGLAVAGTGLMLYSCENEDLMADDPNADRLRRNNDGRQVYQLGKGDIGILNYAFVLESLEAAFYTEVVNGSFWMNDASAEEKKVLEDIYRHELIHRDWFEKVLAPTRNGNSYNVLPGLEFDFSSVDFSSRDDVFQTSILLEDTGVAAYNGAGPLLDNTTYLLLAGKIVSVEARHASAVRSLYNQPMGDFKAFAGNDVVDPVTGLDVAKAPREVLAAASGFITTKIIANNLPTG